jgi:hypothetical protein
VPDAIKISALTHDFAAKRSLVTLVWENDATKSLVLHVPFGCDLDALQSEAEKSVRALSDELSTIAVRMVK